MVIHTSQLAQITGGTPFGEGGSVREFAFDSRSLVLGGNIMFVAFKGSAHNGHNYIGALVERGVRYFIVEQGFDIAPYAASNCFFLVVENSLSALQNIAGYCRKMIVGTVASITGSNGKTIVKEWIARLWTNQDKIFFSSPKSYNSQLGVALSIAMAEKEAAVSLFEAGISGVGQMASLQRIISPDVVLFTNIGEAHSQNFASLEAKVEEKLLLAASAKVLITASSNTLICTKAKEVLNNSVRLFTWGWNLVDDVCILSQVQNRGRSAISFKFNNKVYNIEVPFTDNTSLENIMHVIAFYCCVAPCELPGVALRVASLEAVAMRLELRRGRGGSKIISDTYNSDLGSLSIALDYMVSVCDGMPMRVVLSDIFQSGYSPDVLYAKVAEMVRSKGVQEVVAIGEGLISCRALFDGISCLFYNTTDEFLNDLPLMDYSGSVVLLKGSRAFAFERISYQLEEQIHSTVFEVDLGAMASNLDYYRAIVGPKVLTMAMVKASSYGSGAVEVALALEKRHINYLAVAYADEGVELRRAGVITPIVVLNSEPSGYTKMVEYNLEPEIYDFFSLRLFYSESVRLGVAHYPIHIKIDTGMHRLGFEEADIAKLILELKAMSRNVLVRSIFSHLTSADNPSHDEFTLSQISLFDRLSSQILAAFPSVTILRHICNSAAIERFGFAHFDMVRLGIGLYGIGCTEASCSALQPVGALKSVISQIRECAVGESVGYNRQQVLTRNSRIATIPIGYADGLRRSLSCGKWAVEVRGSLAPIVGNICMDACMVDITDISAQIGDSVVIFGLSPTVSRMAMVLGTIPYEILTSIAPRVKRIYFS